MFRAITGIVAWLCNKWPGQPKHQPDEAGRGYERRRATGRRFEAGGQPKRRHAHQVMRWEDLVVGQEYTSVNVRECDGRMFEYRRIFAGSFTSKPRKSQLPPNIASHYEKMRFTVHLDGRHFDDSLSNEPSYLLWGGDGKPCTYGSVNYLLDGWNESDHHEILVPTDRWQADPTVAVDWKAELMRSEEVD